MTVLEIKNLVKRYGNVLALDNLSLTIKEGEVFGLLGPNGAGKTTFINCILGLTNIDRGEIYIFEKPLNKALKELKSQIGIVPQEISLYSNLTVYENLSFFGSLYNLSGKLLKERIEFALEFVQMQDSIKKQVKNLSGGMKRRINIAAALLNSPKLLIMDEPTVGIDIYSRKLILESVQKLAQSGITIIYTTHYIEEVDRICTSVAFINKGTIIEYGSKEFLLKKLSDTNIIRIKLSKILDEVLTKIKNLDGVESVAFTGDELTVSVEKSKNLIKEIVETLSQDGCEILSISYEKPTMEKLYFAVMGYTIDEKGEIVHESSS
ncbi:ABC-2 type transport system ATP-binding protein [Caldicellulosiruptor bescii]|uniref:ABC transporter related protein n=3 Tax=Caldicellulosiruptor TaxID=44000 RepID=A4XGW6_CALS8|nr:MULTISPECIES: ABC transporter ATP-binding protein [Caldicellulosiruptor]ABP66151.1 ABC transporter related protein [Caldicellulosiruptor saccharolyticus DSM 8903]ACM61688.1 ABC transporter related [Caldicellulosiruptor bescii DSM 6725]PBC88507.1 ABC-2 type transport system ATP-binding protein [Caldicellulosiruptor bescii]PBC92011.1 ABC-2 type transport system ATP-binding protein [Caldicellulosiruptor bescii]PBD02575.1 ABC-2 type transport system ATP-binding protein [Caldicellulosiruptor bes